MIYKGSSGKEYTLSTQLKSGGEGLIYELPDHPHQVAKIYKESLFNEEGQRRKKERKLKTMLQRALNQEESFSFTIPWPQEILYNSQGNMCGFLMPRISGYSSISELMRMNSGFAARIRQQIPDFTWKCSVQAAYNLAAAVQALHDHDVVIGDLNLGNIGIDFAHGGRVILFDCDSFDIRDPETGEHFGCEVGFQELLAPEIMIHDELKNAVFTRSSDSFSLAVHIFNLLLKNQGPFTSVAVNPDAEDNPSIRRQILTGSCVFVKDVPGRRMAPASVGIHILPEGLQMLFKRTFDYTWQDIPDQVSARRPQVKEWLRELYILAAPEPNENLTRCPVNPEHVYPAINTRCPWCVLENARIQQNRRLKSKLELSKIQTAVYPENLAQEQSAPGYVQPAAPAHTPVQVQNQPQAKGKSHKISQMIQTALGNFLLLLGVLFLINLLYLLIYSIL